MVKVSSMCSIAFGVAALAVSSFASAGEVTGGQNPKPTGVRDHTSSICAFSGLEDGIYLSGFGPNGPIFLPTTDSGPGFVQTPSHETSPGIDHDPGVAGDSCRGGSWPLTQ
jgi:hypothetical protein